MAAVGDPVPKIDDRMPVTRVIAMVTGPCAGAGSIATICCSCLTPVNIAPLASVRAC
ncbi:MAG: hypothetical protein LC790_08705 [Actinobacteria bacterium]|nr:hypothetical protein [Actinomycetota bacterium]